MKSAARVFITVITALFLAGSGVAADEAADWFEKGRTYEVNGDYQAAIKAYDEAISYRTENAAVFFRRARLTFETEPTHIVEAIRYYSQGLDLDTGNADAYYARGLLHAYALNNTLAREDMETAARLGHKEAVEWLAAGNNEGGGSPSLITFSDYPGIAAEPVLYFDYDAADIRPDQYPLIDAVGELLADELSGVRLILAAHACEIGSEEYNHTLSLKRGVAVKNYICQRHGIAHNRVVVKPFGETHPAVPNTSDDNRALNRRVEIVGVR